MPEPNSKAFFNQKRTAPEIKSVLLPEFFKVWLAGLLSENGTSDKWVFADVNAGPAYDTDGNSLAPVKILSEINALKDVLTEAGKTIQPIFLDTAKPVVAKLKTDLENLEFYEQLAPQPLVSDQVNLPEELPDLLQSDKPLFLSLDPFSTEFSGEVFNQTAAKTNADLYLFFSPSKMQKAIFPDKKTETENSLAQQLFGEKLPGIERIYKGENSAKKREQILLEHFENVLQDKDRFTFTFRINAPGKDQAAFYLVFTTFNKLLYLQLKEQVLPYTDFQEDGVPLFGVNLNYQPASIPGFSTFLNKYSLENLVNYLAGSKSLYHYETVQEIYESHSPGTHYVKANYLTALRQLLDLGRINLINEKNRQVNTITGSSVVFYKLHSSKK